MESLGYFEREIISELKNQGYEYTDANDIFKQKELDLTVTNVILKWLPQVYSEHYGTADILVRSLMSAKDSFDPTCLINLYENTNLNFSLKDGIALTLASAKTTDISAWIKDQLLNKKYALERCSLVWGLPAKGGFSDKAELINFLKQIFNKYHDDVVLNLFKKYGSYLDIIFLEGYVKQTEKNRSSQMQRTIKFLKRLKI